MTDDTEGRVARLKAGLNLNLNNALGAKPPIGFRPVLPAGSGLEVAKKPPPPPVSPKPRAPAVDRDSEAKKAEAMDTDAVVDADAANRLVSVSKLREKLQVAIPAFNPNVLADTVDGSHNADAETSPARGVPASLSGTKRKTPESGDSEEHRPLECLTKGRPKMARRRAPTTATASAPTDSQKTESEVAALSLRVNSIAVNVNVNVRNGDSTGAYSAMHADDSGDGAQAPQKLEPVQLSEHELSNTATTTTTLTTPTHNSDVAVTPKVTARDESSSGEEDFESECTEF